MCIRSDLSQTCVGTDNLASSNTTYDPIVEDMLEDHPDIGGPVKKQSKEYLSHQTERKILAEAGTEQAVVMIDEIECSCYHERVIAVEQYA